MTLLHLSLLIQLLLNYSCPHSYPFSVRCSLSSLNNSSFGNPFSFKKCIMGCDEIRILFLAAGIFDQGIGSLNFRPDLPSRCSGSDLYPENRSLRIILPECFNNTSRTEMQLLPVFCQIPNLLYRLQ